MLSRRMAWMVALVATFTMTVSYVDRNALGVLAPVITKELGISDSAYGWAGAAFSIAYLFGTPLAGWWIDVAGARRGLLVSVLAWSAVAALHAVVPGFAVLFVLRLALGATEAASFPGAAQTMRRILPPEELTRGFGVLFTGSSFGAMLVPPFASLIYGLAGWRVALLVTTAAGLAWVPLWLAVTRSRSVRTQLDLPPTASARPPFFELVAHPIMLRALAAITAAAPVIGFDYTWGAKYLVKTFHVEQRDVGGYLWLPPLVFDAAAVLFGDLASRQRRGEGVPPRLLLSVGVVLAAAPLILPLAATPWQSMAMLSAGMAGAGVMYTLVTADMLARMPPGSTSFAAGILAGSQSLALIICNPLIGRAVDAYGSYDVVCICLGLWALPGGVIWLLWRPALQLIPRRRVISDRAAG
jgi:ACS family hexuronate transporter-like MFS transporter